MKQLQCTFRKTFAFFLVACFVIEVKVYIYTHQYYYIKLIESIYFLFPCFVLFRNFFKRLRCLCLFIFVFRFLNTLFNRIGCWNQRLDDADVAALLPSAPSPQDDLCIIIKGRNLRINIELTNIFYLFTFYSLLLLLSSPKHLLWPHLSPWKKVKRSIFYFTGKGRKEKGGREVREIWRTLWGVCKR